MKIGIQTGRTADEIGYAETYRLFAEAGFEAIDWNLNNRLSGAIIRKGELDGNFYDRSIEEIFAAFEDELAQIRKNGLSIGQAHAPFPAYVPDKPWVLDRMIEIYKKNILFCHQVGCKYLVIHGISLEKNDEFNTKESIRELNDKLYTSLIPTLLGTDVTVCLENLFASMGGIALGVCSDPHEAADMIDTYNSIAGKECFGLCLDTGHLNLLRIDLRNYIPVLGKRIKVLHVHDNAGLTDQHKAPYTGTVAWSSFCEELRKVGYSGDICFETFMQTTLKVIDRKMLEPWLKLIYDIGCHFRSEIASDRCM
ncbi:MAG: sugar phosphate isomerase/epimerase [Clostridia bacterium]|nr:sugar phosphate isomerase/epimerase [Clostridia bacterium]